MKLTVPLQNRNLSLATKNSIQLLHEWRKQVGRNPEQSILRPSTVARGKGKAHRSEKSNVKLKSTARYVSKEMNPRGINLSIDALRVYKTKKAIFINEPI